MRAWFKTLVLKALCQPVPPWPTECGYVSWCVDPPPGAKFELHRLTLADAFETAACFVAAKQRTYDYMATKLVLGSELCAFVTSLPLFKFDELKETDLLRLGFVNNKTVFADFKLKPREGYLVNGDAYVKLAVVNFSP